VEITPFKVSYRMPLLGREETAENSTSEASTSSKEIVPFVFLLFCLITSNIQTALLRAFHRNMVLFTCSKFFMLFGCRVNPYIERKREPEFYNTL
jgi:hypothetical protein